jgi:hypothetical protein
MDRAELIRRATALVPVLRERAPQAEALRCMPQETIDDLCRADLLRAVLPARCGGLGLDFDIIRDVAAELGRGCGSTAWCYGNWAVINWVAGMYPAQAQEEYWAAGPNTFCASGLNPAGTASLTAVTGGYRLSGQWDFASGCDAATWMLIVGAGPPGVLACLVPRAEFTIQDTWFVSGLRGTGSQGHRHPRRLCPRASGAPRGGLTGCPYARTGITRDDELSAPPLLRGHLCAGGAPSGDRPGRGGGLPDGHANKGLGPSGWASGPARRGPGAARGGHRRSR